MNVKKIRYIALALVVAAFCSCQKEPSTSDLHRDYLVYTAHDTGTDFAAIDTYYIPDSILIIGYWGDWVGWHYPYSVYYGYTAGSLLMEMLDLQADQESGKKLPIVWDSFIGGLLTSDADLNQQRTIAAVEQAFEQSPYLAK